MSGNGESLSLESLFAFVDGAHSHGEEELVEGLESTLEEAESIDTPSIAEPSEPSDIPESTEPHVDAKEEPYLSLALPPALPVMPAVLPSVSTDAPQPISPTVFPHQTPAVVPARPPRGKHATHRAGVPRASRGKHVADENLLPVTDALREPIDLAVPQPEPPVDVGQVSVASLLSVSVVPDKERAMEVKKPSKNRQIDGRDLANEMRASIEERLAKMILQQPEADAAKSDERDDATKPTGKVDVSNTILPAEPQDASKSEGNTAQTSATERAATGEDSILFDEPPVSIAESMREANVWHRRSFVLKVSGAVVAVALCAVTIGFLAANMPVPDVAQNDAQLQQEVSDIVEDSNFAPVNDVKVDERNNDEKAQEARDLSGSVVYRYVATNPDGETRTVTETVRFTKDGLCDTSDMEVQFSNEEQAQEFLSQLKRDYGTALKDGSTEGALVLVTIDVQANKLDRESYEDGLRASVEDLVIVKKS